MTEDVELFNADERAITKVMYHYARGVDRVDLALVRSCFAAHATCDYGAFFKGNADDFVKWLGESLRSCVTTMHHFGNVLADIDGDRATSESYCVAYHRQNTTDESRHDLVVGVRYLDDLERVSDGRWGITHRTVVFDWTRIDPVISSLGVERVR